MKLFNRLLLLWALCFTLGSCTEDEIATFHTHNSPVVKLIHPDALTVDINTRSTAEKNVINDVLVVLIRGDQAKYQSFSNVSEGTFTITEFTPQLGERVYFFCNTGKTFVDGDVNTEDKLFEAITTSNTAADLMYGISSDINNGGLNEIKLEHSLAKICLYSDESGLKIVNWKICNVPDKGFMSRKNGYPNGTTSTNVVEARTDSCTFIVPRSDNSSVVSKTYLLLQLEGKGWYRMDFHDGNQELGFAETPTFMNIERNYRYRFNILSVKNDGYQEEQQAAANSGSNIVYNMEILDGSSLSNGQYSLVTSTNDIVLPSLSFTTQLNIMDVSIKAPNALKGTVSGPYSVVLKNSNAGLKLHAGDKSGSEINLLDVVGDDLTQNITLSLSIAGKVNLKDTYLEIRLGNLKKQFPISLQTANCYIHNFQEGRALLIPLEQANKGGKERIDLSDSAKEPDFAILWSDVPMNLSEFSANYDSNSKSVEISKSSPSRFVGNFVIAAIVDSEIKWSWHVWCMDDASVSFNNLSGMYELKNIQEFGGMKWMDRNLGATSATVGDVKSQGLLYQWGRKDPFPSSEELNGNTEPTIYHGTTGYTMQTGHPLYGTCLVTLNELDNIEYSITNPTKLIKGNYYSWILEGETYLDLNWVTNTYNRKYDFLWTTSDGKKEIYDPCPTGWRVAKNGRVGPFSSLQISKATSFTQTGTSWGDIYFPATTYRTEASKMEANSQTAIWWGEIASEGANFNCTTISLARGIDYIKFIGKGFSLPVRCIKSN